MAQNNPCGSPCRYLSTRPVFGTDGPHPAETGLAWTTNQNFKCLVTMEAVGPDEAWVHAERCGPTRSCYRAERRLGPGPGFS